MTTATVVLEAMFEVAGGDAEETERLAAVVAGQLRALQLEGSLDLRDVASNRVRADQDAPEGAKGVAALAQGLVHTVVGAASIRGVLTLLWERLKGSPVIKFKLKSGDRTIDLTVNNLFELERAMELAERFAHGKP